MYFKKGKEEMCYDLETIRDHMRIDHIKELQVFEAEIDIGTGTFYCSKFGGVGDNSDMGCGKTCDEYAPRNGRSGICRYKRNTYSQTDRLVWIKLKADDQKNR